MSLRLQTGSAIRRVNRGFAYIAAPDARVLILGTMPSVKSLEAHEYYANPRNAFWPIMERLLGYPTALPYEARAERLRNAGISLWDVLHSGDRPGSLDASIVSGSETANDFAGFFAAHPRVRTVFFNGAKAEDLFRRLVLPGLPAGLDLQLVRLPSTSPANASLNLEGKLRAWSSVLDALVGSTSPARRVRALLASGNVLLAPMAGITEAPFRGICKRLGAGLTYTEMVSAKGLHYNPDSRISNALLTLAPEETPCAVQIFGAEPEMMAEQAARIVERHGANVALIDINMGCPVTKVVAKGEGSALMRTPQLAARVVTAVATAVAVPVTVKFRKGWDAETVNAVEFAQLMEASGAAALAVHGRTRSQFYRGAADWNAIGDVKAAVGVPVIGSGDVFSAADAAAMLEQTGVDAVMVARGAQGNPWIFREARALIDDGVALQPPSPFERIDTAREHAAALVETGGERAFTRMRKHVAWYMTGMPGAMHVRDRANHARSYAELDALLLEYRDYLGARQSGRTA
jgi:tRNA-dihydrouridine synthase B